MTKIYFDHSADMTKQTFKDEVNINNIMARFQRTGAIDHYAKHGASYGDATPIQLIDAMNIIADAESMFEELPASLRKQFENSPEKFLEFVQDENNLDEMRELGLAIKEGAPVVNDEPNDETPPAPPPMPDPE